MKCVGLAAAVGLALGTSSARADSSDSPPPLHEILSAPAEEDTIAGNAFDAVGSRDRIWQLESTTAYSTQRIATQRFDVAAAISFAPSLSLILRLGVAGDDNTGNAFYSLQGPIGSVGVLAHTAHDDYRVEFGVRIIPNWNGPHDGEPDALGTALRATLASDASDDARWLPFADWGTQIYARVQNRENMFAFREHTYFWGARYGGEVSLSPLVVNSWLGPQTGIIGNAFAELFLGFSCHRTNCQSNVEFGGRADVSLSSIWPGEDPFPYILSLFVAWSPARWVVLRGFGGSSGTVQPVAGSVPSNTPYGVRAEFFVP